MLVYIAVIVTFVRSVKLDIMSVAKAKAGYIIMHS